MRNSSKVFYLITSFFLFQAAYAEGETKSSKEDPSNFYKVITKSPEKKIHILVFNGDYCKTDVLEKVGKDLREFIKNGKELEKKSSKEVDSKVAEFLRDKEEQKFCRFQKIRVLSTKKEITHVPENSLIVAYEIPEEGLLGKLKHWTTPVVCHARDDIKVVTGVFGLSCNELQVN